MNLPQRTQRDAEDGKMSESYYLVEAYGTRTEGDQDTPDERALYSKKDEALRVWKKANELGVGARISVIEPDRQRERTALEGFIEDQALLSDVKP